MIQLLRRNLRDLTRGLRRLRTIESPRERAREAKRLALIARDRLHRRIPVVDKVSRLLVGVVRPRSEPQREDYLPVIEVPGRSRAHEFDAAFYRRANVDVAGAGIDPLDHYRAHGWREGRWPNPFFSPLEYLALNGDVAKARVEPLLHYRNQGRHETRERFRSPARLGEAWTDRATHAARLVTPSTDARNAPVRVSVIIPVFERPDLLVKCLASIPGSVTRSRHEIIVVDDGSTEETRRRLQQLVGIELIVHPRNLGFAHACNTGAARATGSLLVFVNSDSELEDHCIDRLVEAYDQMSDTHGIFGAELVNPEGSHQESGASLEPGAWTSALRTPIAADGRNRVGRTVDYVSAAVALIPAELYRALGGMDVTMARAYYEDVDLCIRARRDHERATMVVRDARAVHQLSASMSSHGNGWKLRESERARRAFVSRHPELAFPTTTVLAFHLPAFHADPFNDRFWGQGFTEWDNVRAATPRFPGHEQPLEPASGAYDLADPGVIAEQFALASEHGVDAFCFYHYSLAGDRPLRAPVDALLARPDLDVPYCLCWANEPWTRTWDGGDGEALLRQSMDDADIDSAADSLAPFLVDQRYVRVDGRPLLLWYRPTGAADPARAAARLRDRLAARGVGDVWLTYVESHDLAAHPVHPDLVGCDASVEFPPHELAIPIDTSHLVPTDGIDLSRSFSYPGMVDAVMRRPHAGWIRYRTVVPSWDNTPRQPDRPTVFHGSAPEIFGRWVRWACSELRRTQSTQHRLLFVNAWNEWGEGAVLEPDRAHGRAALETLRNALDLDLVPRGA